MVVMFDIIYLKLQLHMKCHFPPCALQLIMILRATRVGTLPGNKHPIPVCIQHSLIVQAWQFISPTCFLTIPEGCMAGPKGGDAYQKPEAQQSGDLLDGK